MEKPSNKWVDVHSLPCLMRPVGIFPIQEDGHHSIDIPIMVIDDGMGNIS